MPWIEFFLQGVAEQGRDATQRAAALLDLREQYRTQLYAVQASTVPLRLVDALFTSPALTARQAATLLGITPRAAQQNIEKLMALGILREITGRSRNRVYTAPAIVQILEAPAAE